MAVDGILSMWNNMGKLPLFIFFRDSRNVLKKDELGIEIANIGLPATFALMADPIASLIDTSFIGRIGAVELASVGVSVAIFNQVSRITMLPLVSITTSFVAEEEATSKYSTEAEDDENVRSNHDMGQEMVPLTGNSDMKIAKSEDNRRHVPSASSALLIGCMLGILQTLFLISTAKPLLHYMGVKPESPMLKIAQQYLTLRSLGAPAILLSLAAQGVFRGLKDTKTPFYAISKQASILINVDIVGHRKQLVKAYSDNPLERNSLNGTLYHLAAIAKPISYPTCPFGFLIMHYELIGDSANILLDPIFIFTLRLGVNGAAIAHVVSQEKENDIEQLQDHDMCDVTTSGFQLLVKVISTTSCITLATSLVARLGPKPMAAFQVCLQIWMATSLLADGLAVAGQNPALFRTNQNHELPCFPFISLSHRICSDYIVEMVAGGREYGAIRPCMEGAILASAFARKDYEKTVAAASRVLQIGLLLGLLLSFFLAAVSRFASTLFTKDFDVLNLMNISFPFIAVTQPINALAFVFDGVNYGASDFAYSAYSMVGVAVMSISCLFILSSSHGYIGIWIALTIFMCLRVFAGLLRIGTGMGPWTFLWS
ncbi:MATE efflux family protein isoform 2 [Hibiscus syriacus]|uniref:Protein DETOXIFICATION n=1 Tax=Hibiscus syriacus TaxID=106335 RepID=A0A6A3AJE8_HIBSY|nr:MATE efflux family protein isoform 2 [Hibiscus syriacus]